jgi:CO/xanthine dehydrogenase Mo-binding subunit
MALGRDQIDYMSAAYAADGTVIVFTDVQYDLYGVFTNKVPTDAYRGAGRPEATYLLERMMDAIADDLGLDPVDVRKRILSNRTSSHIRRRWAWSTTAATTRWRSTRR